MEGLFLDKEKISLFSKIQNNLKALKPNASQYAINQIINQIPPKFLAEKEDFMTLCLLFAYYGRNSFTSYKGNAVKIFEKIIDYMKKHLQNESSFVWKLFGGLFYFKLWMHEEGLISIEQIIQFSQSDSTNYTIEYFLPEIIEQEPEIYYKQIKYKLNKPELEEKIEDYKKLRKRHLKWLRDSANYQDPAYKEIETNKLRLVIKMDDIDAFQRIISNTNISLNSNIHESALENVFLVPSEVSLLEYAAELNSIKIFKFLIMNGVTISKYLMYAAIGSRNYDIVHIIEQLSQENYKFNSIIWSVSYWHDELTEYTLNFYNDNFIEKSEAISERKNDTIELISQTFKSINFCFFESTILPFLEKNPEFVNDNINEIIMCSINDNSCYFFNELVKHSKFDINYISEREESISFFGLALRNDNTAAIEFLLRHPLFDINRPIFKDLSPLHLSCRYFTETKIVEKICKMPNLDVNLRCQNNHLTAFELGGANGNIYALKYLTKNFKNLEMTAFEILFFHCLRTDHLMTLKILMDYYIDVKNPLNPYQMVTSLIDNNHGNANFKLDFVDKFSKILCEILKSKVRPPKGLAIRSIRAGLKAKKNCLKKENE